jgi:trimeric autotransporter adhesin
MTVVSARTGEVDRRFAVRPITAAAPDGRGGWYVGEDVGFAGSGSLGLARLDRNGWLGARFGPRYRGSVNRLIRLGTTLYAAAGFGVFAVDTRSGRTLWKFRSKGPVYSLALGDGKVFGTQESGSLAVLDIHTGRSLSWEPRTFQTAEAVAVGDGAVFVGGPGGLSMIDLRSRRVLGHPRWPRLPNEVLSLAFLHHELLAAGLHGDVGFAAFDPRTGKKAPWFPLVGGMASAFALDGTTLYLGGNLQTNFTSVGPYAANNLGAVRLPAGPALNWTPNLAKAVSVQDIVPSGDKVLVTGQFCTSLG